MGSISIGVRRPCGIAWLDGWGHHTPQCSCLFGYVRLIIKRPSPRVELIPPRGGWGAPCRMQDVPLPCPRPRSGAAHAVPARCSRERSSRSARPLQQRHRLGLVAPLRPLQRGLTSCSRCGCWCRNCCISTRTTRACPPISILSTTRRKPSGAMSSLTTRSCFTIALRTRSTPIF